MKTLKNYETYPLSPLQEGMLFHTLSAPGSGVDIPQVLCTVKEPLNLDAFKAAWEAVVNRHAVLRTRFEWEGLDNPIQVVESNVTLPLDYCDWRHLTDSERENRIEEFRKTDRMRGCDMSEAPMMRVTLFELETSEYRFLFTHHHAVLDGRSVWRVLREFFNFYYAYSERTNIEIEDSRLYRDYIEWMQKRDVSQDETYWRKTLKGFDSPAPIWVAGTDAGFETAYGTELKQTIINEHDTSELKSFARKNKLTLNTLVQGAWGLLLHHYNDKNDIVFGTTRACRHSTVEGADTMVGLLINTLPLRIKINKEQTLISYLKDLRQQNLILRQFESTPLQIINQWSDLPPGTQLFDSIVVFEKSSFNQYFRSQGERWLNKEFAVYQQTGYPITLNVFGDQELKIQVFFEQRFIDHTVVKRMMDYLKKLLLGMPLHGDHTAVRLPYLSDLERQTLLVEWNATYKDYPLENTLVDFFESQVERTPEAVALKYEDSNLTYRELNDRANQLAHHLRRYGVGPDIPVGIFMERSLEMVLGIYGIIKAGGAYVPLDPEYPGERLGFMISDTRVSVLLTQRHLVDRLPEHGANVICLDAEWDAIDVESTQNPDKSARPENLAYIIYTSGSTGKPKGVMNEHRGIVNRLLWMQDAYQLSVSDRVLQKTPFSFDVSVWEFFWPLQVGAQLVVALPGGHRDNTYLVRMIREKKITTLHFVPSMLQLFLEEDGVESLRSIKRVICSGEALRYEHKKRFFERLDTELHNLYGPTEAAVDVTYWSCQRDDDRRVVPIGYPVANTQIYILDSVLQPVPVGCPGELHIGGVQVARGYLNRPKLTAETFISDPFSTRPDARLYKTGDLARYMPDGSIEYLGRNDFQIKIRGLRIEIGEIEEVLTQHPEVREGVVVAREDVPGDKRLVAYLTGKQKAEINLDKLREFLKVKLPVYMVPAAFVQLETFPLTGSGKVDRKALPAPKGGRQTKKAYEAPKGRVEQIIAKIWQEVLEFEEVGIHDNFFDLGGHSLLLVRMRNRLQEHFEKEISIVDMFQRPTIKDLAKFLSDEQKGEPSFDRIRERAMRQKEILKRRRQVFERQGDPNE